MEIDKILRTGDIINIEGDGLVSKLIKIFTRGRWTHSAAYYKDGYVIESDWGGVQLNHLSKYKGKRYAVFRHKTAEQGQLDLAVDWMITQYRSGYDFYGLVGIALKIIGLTKRNELDEADRYWCSELIIDGYHKAHIKTGYSINTFTVSPNDIARNPLFKKVTEGYFR